MKIQTHSIWAARKQNRHGSAVFVVFVLISIVLIYIAGNGAALRQLKTEMRLIEKQQRKKFEPANGGAPRGAATNKTEAVKEPKP